MLVNNTTLHTWSCKQIATCFGQIGGNINFDYETGKPLACSSLVEESFESCSIYCTETNGGCACSFI